VSIYLSVRSRIENKPHVQTSRNLLYVIGLPVAIARASSDNNTIRYVLPVLWMTSYLPIIGDAKAILTRRILEVTHRGLHQEQSLVATIILLCCFYFSFLKYINVQYLKLYFKYFTEVADIPVVVPEQP